MDSKLSPSEIFKVHWKQYADELTKLYGSMKEVSADDRTKVIVGIYQTYMLQYHKLTLEFFKFSDDPFIKDYFENMINENYEKNLSLTSVLLYQIKESVPENWEGNSTLYSSTFLIHHLCAVLKYYELMEEKDNLRKKYLNDNQELWYRLKNGLYQNEYERAQISGILDRNVQNYKKTDKALLGCVSGWYKIELSLYINQLEKYDFSHIDKINVKAYENMYKFVIEVLKSFANENFANHSDEEFYEREFKNKCMALYSKLEGLASKRLEEKRKYDKELEIKEYWESHPEEFEKLNDQLEENQNRLIIINKDIAELHSQIADIDNKKKQFEINNEYGKKIDEARDRLRDATSELSKLGIFRGKRKKELNIEIENINIEMENIRSEMKVAVQEFNKKCDAESEPFKNELKSKEAELREICKNISDIQNTLSRK